MPLLQRAELLQRQRVDGAEHRQLALGRAQPLLLLLADERHRLGLGRSVGPVGPSAQRLGLLTVGQLVVDGDRLVGAVVGDQHVGVEAELLERALLELLDPHLLLGAGHLVAVHGVDQLVVLTGQVAQPGADGEQLLLAALAGPLDLGAGRGGPADRDVEPVEHVGDRGADRLGGLALAEQPGPALDLAGAGLALLLGGAQQLVGPAVQGAGPLLGGAQREPGLHLALPGGAGGLGELLAVVGDVLEVGVLLGPGQPGLELAEARRGPSSRASRASAIARSSRSASPRAARAWAPNWPSSSATAARVASDSCSLASATSTRFWASCRSRSSRDMSKPSRSVAATASASCWVASSTAAWISIRLGWLAEPPAATWAPSRSPSRVTAVSEASRATQRAGGGQVVDHGDPVEQPGQRRAHGVGAGDHVEGVRRALGQRRPAADVVRSGRSRAPARPGRGRAP